MGHHNTIKNYSRLSDRINLFPQGAPPSALLFEILKILFTEKEAGLVSLLPIKPFTSAKAARIWKMKIKDAELILNDLADRGLLVDAVYKDSVVYTMPPPMAGFFEFSLMRYRKDLDQKTLSELYYTYINQEDDFVRELFAGGDTQLGRTYVNENVLSNEIALHILGYERASEIVKTAEVIGIGTCYCRHKMQHAGKNCRAPVDEICMTFNGCADSLTRHGIARKIGVSQGLDVLQKARSYNLLQIGENVQEKVSFICNCCGCCCEALTSARKLGFLNTVITTNFIPAITEDKCDGCGKCVTLCPIEAMSVVSANDPADPKRKKARLDHKTCLGCGVCLTGCRKNALKLVSRETRVITPVDSVHRIVLMAIERGKLQNLIFDDHAYFSHRALAAIFGVILRLPPMKQVLASRQFRSRYLLSLIKRSNVNRGR